MSSDEASEIIDFLGGTAAVASLCGVSAPSVSDWRGKGIPDARLIRLAPELEARAGTRWTRKTLFPNDWQHIWPELSKRRRKVEAA